MNFWRLMQLLKMDEKIEGGDAAGDGGDGPPAADGAKELFNDIGGEGGTGEKPNEAAKPLYDGFKKINNTDEAVSYIKELEAKAFAGAMAQNQLANAQAAAAPAAPPPVRDPLEGIEEEIFSNPKEAVKKIKEAAKAEIRAENDKVSNEKQFWTDFYDKAPDLRNADLVVQSVLRERWEQVKALPQAEAQKVLAEESRRAVDKIRGGDGKKTELSRTTAGTLPASGGTTPKVPAAEEPPTRFVDQVRNMQAKRRKA